MGVDDMKPTTYNTRMSVALPWGPWVREEKIRPYITWLEAAGVRVVRAERVEDLRFAERLLLPGGPDVDPRYYGEQNRFPDKNTIDSGRDTLEFALLEEAMERDMPVLAICRGIQVVNVFFGGSLYQHLPAEHPSFLHHARPASDDPLPEHPVMFLGTLPERYRLNTQLALVNSSHHQAIRRVAPSLEMGGVAPDGVVEMVYAPDARFLLGVQWHPEREPEKEISTILRTRFLEA